MPQIPILPAILSGGAGTRLWPASTSERPKQFHAFAGERTLFQDTVLRVTGAHGDLAFQPPLVLANARHADLIEAQLDAVSIAPAGVVLEPMGRNTAAAALIAAAFAEAHMPGALVLLLPADHVIADRGAFLDVIARAAGVARTRIVTFGITPERPETGYGYIKRGAALGEGVYAIDAFREKPDAATAQGYLDAGGYAWNAGMFLFDPGVLIGEFAHAPDIRDAGLAAFNTATRAGARLSLGADAFASVPGAPLDTAIMEKTAKGAVAPCSIGWADLGSWSEIWRLGDKDANGNVVRGDALLADAHNNLVRAEGVRVAIAGADDLIVVASGGTVLIVPRARAQDVKRLWEDAQKR